MRYAWMVAVLLLPGCSGPGVNRSMNGVVITDTFPVLVKAVHPWDLTQVRGIASDLTQVHSLNPKVIAPITVYMTDESGDWARAYGMPVSELTLQCVDERGCTELGSDLYAGDYTRDARGEVWITHDGVTREHWRQTVAVGNRLLNSNRAK